MSHRIPQPKTAPSRQNKLCQPRPGEWDRAKASTRATRKVSFKRSFKKKAPGPGFQSGPPSPHRGSAGSGNLPIPVDCSIPLPGRFVMTGNQSQGPPRLGGETIGCHRGTHPAAVPPDASLGEYSPDLRCLGMAELLQRAPHRQSKCEVNAALGFRATSLRFSARNGPPGGHFGSVPDADWNYSDRPNRPDDVKVPIRRSEDFQHVIGATSLL